MQARTTAARTGRRPGAALVGAWLAVCAGTLGLAETASAQWCQGPLPTPGRPPVVSPGGEKFALAAAQCPALGERKAARIAAQLSLYERDGVPSRAIPFDGPADAVPPSTASPAPPLPGAASASAAAPTSSTAPPLDRRGSRIVSIAPAVAQAARTHGIDPLLLHAIAHVESRHNPAAVSPAGARGLMQMMPATAERFGVESPVHTLHDVPTNLRASASLLRTLLRRYDDDLSLVLAAYNAGEGAVARAGGRVPNYPETQAYVRDVLAVYRRLKDTFSLDRRGELVARGDPS
ncbi:MAG: lytic transglycosylase domain-containing protein [Rubrivivax sp.]